MAERIQPQVFERVIANARRFDQSAYTRMRAALSDSNMTPAGAAIAQTLPESAASLNRGQLLMLLYWTAIHLDTSGPRTAGHSVWDQIYRALAAGVSNEVRAWARDTWDDAPFYESLRFEPIGEVESYSVTHASSWGAQDDAATFAVYVGDPPEVRAGIGHFVGRRPPLTGRLAEWYRSHSGSAGTLPTITDMVPGFARTQNVDAGQAVAGGAAPVSGTQGQSPFGGMAGTAPDLGLGTGEGGTPPGQSDPTPGEDEDDADRINQRSELATLLAIIAKYGFPQIATVLKIILIFAIELIYIILKENRRDDVAIPKDEAIAKMYRLVDNSTKLNVKRPGRPEAVLSRWQSYWAGVRARVARGRQ